jgi:hypothetical protein
MASCSGIRSGDGRLPLSGIWTWRYACNWKQAQACALSIQVDSSSAPTLAATLLVWDLESREGTQLVGAVEFQVTWTDRAVNTQLVRDSEAVLAEKPGDLPLAAGRLASRGLTLAASKR